MGKITVQGKGIVYADADLMEIEIRFERCGRSLKELISLVHEQCEMFIKDLLDIGVAQQDIQFLDDEINENYSDKTQMKVVRKILLSTAINFRLCSYIFNLITKNDYKIRYDISFRVRDEVALERLALQEAIEDSRKKAEIIAESLGQKVVGIDSASDTDFSYRTLTKSIVIDDTSLCIPEMFKSDTPLTDKLTVPQIPQEEKIEIVWLIE